MKIGIIMLVACLLTITSFADVSSDLGSYFDSLGMQNNVTAPHAYQGQQAGYYSGGSLFARNSVRNIQLVEIDLPSFKAGCGGIDLFAGGFSFVNSDQLVNVMRNVLNNAKGYAFTLAMEEVTPQIANGMKYIQDMANKVNQMNINSCEMAENLVGGLWPKTRASQQQVCQDIGTNTGLFSDWAASRQGCTTGNFSSTMAKGVEDPYYKNLVLDSGNIAWRALQLNHLTAHDEQLAELMMSLSGTIIIQRNGSNDDAINRFKSLSSLASDHTLLKAILNGGNATIYKCDEATQCLNPTKQMITINGEVAFKNQIAKLLANISQKIISDQALSEQEIGLLQSTRIPIYKILNVQAAYQKDSTILDVQSYSDLIATDILFQYLQENINIIRVASESLQYPTEIMNQFKEGINAALRDVRVEQKNAQVQISLVMQLIEQTQVIEQMLAGELSTQLSNNLEWARGLHG